MADKEISFTIEGKTITITQTAVEDVAPQPQPEPEPEPTPEPQPEPTPEPEPEPTPEPEPEPTPPPEDLVAGFIEPEFGEELRSVAPDKAFKALIRPEYGENEWSVDGWTIYGGSDAACAHGASEALYQMGFRFYTPDHSAKPDRVPAEGVQLARQEFDIPYLDIFLGYGYREWFDEENEVKLARWEVLNTCRDKRLPNGHSWPNIINAIEAEDGFFSENPTYWVNPGLRTSTFNLDLTGEDYDRLVTRTAEFLRKRAEQSNYIAFDPQDGSTWSSDQVFGFANAVLDELHETHPDAWLGLYAYAGHRAPPSFECPRCYVNIAEGFSSLGLGYTEMFRRWGEKAGQLGVRDYGIIAAWKNWDPFVQIGQVDAYENYKGYVENGLKNVIMETTANWLPGIIGHYRLIRMARDVNTTHEDILSDLTEKMFNQDPAARALFLYWSTEPIGSNKFTWRRSLEMVEELQEGWLKTDLKQYLTWMVWHYVKGKGARLEFTDEYAEDLEQMLRWAMGLGEKGVIHRYAFIRRVANAHVKNNGRPDLAFDYRPHPDWKFSRELPTEQDFQDIKLYLEQQTERLDELYDDTLVLAQVTPYASRSDALSATDYQMRESPVMMKYIGPGTVTLNGETTQYGEGLHDIVTRAGKGDGLLASFDGGMLFLSNFPKVRLDPSPDRKSERWIYVPKNLESTKVWGASRLAIYDSNGRQEIEEPGAILDEGHVMIHNGLTIGQHYNDNCNPWLSPHPYLALVPRALAERDGLTIVQTFE